eukprot:scaffold973_cov399-Prasinococcus_capsulatus_cf.AAC.35
MPAPSGAYDLEQVGVGVLVMGGQRDVQRVARAAGPELGGAALHLVLVFLVVVAARLVDHPARHVQQVALVQREVRVGLPHLHLARAGRACRRAHLREVLGGVARVELRHVEGVVQRPALAALHLQDEGVDVVEVRREALAAVGREVGVAPRVALPVTLQHGQQQVQRVHPPLRVQEPHRATVRKFLPHLGGEAPHASKHAASRQSSRERTRVRSQCQGAARRADDERTSAVAKQAVAAAPAPASPSPAGCASPARRARRGRARTW